MWEGIGQWVNEAKALAPTLTINEGFGAPGRTRTCDPLLRRQMLYPLSYGSLATVGAMLTRGKIRPK